MKMMMKMVVMTMMMMMTEITVRDSIDIDTDDVQGLRLNPRLKNAASPVRTEVFRVFVSKFNRLWYAARTGLG